MKVNDKINNCYSIVKITFVQFKNIIIKSLNNLYSNLNTIIITYSYFN